MAAPIQTPVLLVDDRPENIRALMALLEDLGFDLVQALSGNEALRLTLRTEFALVLLDVQMPDMDGFETAELLRAKMPTTSERRRSSRFCRSRTFVEWIFRQSALGKSM